MKRFEVAKTEIKEIENGIKYIDIYDTDNNNWYEEQKNFKPETIKIMYEKDSFQIISKSIDVSMLAPTKIGDVIEEIESKDFELKVNHYFLNGKIIELGDFEKIENGKVVFNLEEKKEAIRKELITLKTEHSEKQFVFKEKYIQKNRDLDKNNLTSIVVMLTATKQTHFKGWKFKNLDNNDVYVDLTLQDMILLANTMTAQTTKAMKIESDILVKLETMTDEELKNFNTEEEYEKLWS